MVKAPGKNTAAPAEAQAAPDMVEAGGLGDIFAFEQRGDVLKGTLVKKFNYKDNFSKECTGYVILDAADGSKKTVFQRGNLKSLMDEVVPGKYVEIKYLGMIPLKNGQWKGKGMHTFNVRYSK